MDGSGETPEWLASQYEAIARNMTVRATDEGHFAGSDFTLDKVVTGRWECEEGPGAMERVMAEARSRHLDARMYEALARLGLWIVEIGG